MMTPYALDGDHPEDFKTVANRQERRAAERRARRNGTITRPLTGGLTARTVGIRLPLPEHAPQPGPSVVLQLANAVNVRLLAHPAIRRSAIALADLQPDETGGVLHLRFDCHVDDRLLDGPPDTALQAVGLAAAVAALTPTSEDTR